MEGRCSAAILRRRGVLRDYLAHALHQDREAISMSFRISVWGAVRFITRELSLIPLAVDLGS